MVFEPTFFVRPEGSSLTLRVPPRLASWNATGHKDQNELSAALDDAEDLLKPCLTGLVGPLSLRLDVGLSDQVKLLDQHDLDNYLFPLARRLTKDREFVLASVWATKSVGETSSVRCESSHIRVTPEEVGYRATIRTTASAQTKAYKQQINGHLASAEKLADGPVALELAFVVGSRRNWLNLWKPTIDALDRLLGRTRPEREWNPLDGRIIDLGMHCVIDPALGNDVAITVVARSLASEVVG